MTRTYEELCQLKQAGKIGWNQFLLESDFADEYLQWCSDHGTTPNDDNAELYCDMMDEKMQEALAASMED